MNKFSILLFISMACFTVSAVDTKPNIVLIMVDDMGYECISSNGSEDYRTPVLDKLAETGMSFEQCFANPICTPSRVKIMTGLYNKRNFTKFGVLDRSQTTFAHQLKKSGLHNGNCWQMATGKRKRCAPVFRF